MKYIWKFENPALADVNSIPKNINAAPSKLVDKYQEALLNAKKVRDNSKANEAKAALETALNNMKTAFITGTKEDPTYSDFLRGYNSLEEFLPDEFYNNIIIVDTEIIDKNKIHPSFTPIKKFYYDRLNSILEKSKTAKNQLEYEKLVDAFRAIIEQIKNDPDFYGNYGNNVYMEPFKYNVPIAGEGDERDVNGVLLFYRNGSFKKDDRMGLAETKKSFTRDELFYTMYNKPEGYFNNENYTDYGANITYNIVDFDNEKGTIRVNVVASKGNITKSKEITISGFLTKEQAAKNEEIKKRITRYEFALDANSMKTRWRAFHEVGFGVYINDIVRHSQDLRELLKENKVNILDDPTEITKIDDVNGILKVIVRFTDETEIDWCDIEITLTSFLTYEKELHEIFEHMKTHLKSIETKNSTNKKADEVTYKTIEDMANDGINVLQWDYIRNHKGLIISIVPGTEINDVVNGTKTITINLTFDSTPGAANINHTIKIHGFKK
ncbi:lipoprotein 17-related variable surface protein [Mycoplasmopsis equigenitalium]|uniref:Lipoprotein 17-related variable surface protein n=1 Tax=Mycoplasmopsis equigenitalium TaxID=114883 RepID=A0ABY5J1P2_9BACT|nr:lipoprotein 17-related variable surface protein [Mycoplasmopsis equigenitalium]UUD36693.1 lipoprotein 17-related variable surface protein [Mycoplasmopsis equigenitalium]